MHPAFMARHMAAHRRYGCHPGASFGGGYEAAGFHEGHFGRAFGVRRPLRFLAFKLELDEDQVEQLAAILDDLKTERAQAEVDDRRALKAFAEAVGGESFDRAAAEEAARRRVETTERLQKTVVDALERIHAVLTPEQRSRLAYLIRSGTLAL